jgi:hypothetical protein
MLLVLVPGNVYMLIVEDDRLHSGALDGVVVYALNSRLVCLLLTYLAIFVQAKSISSNGRI